MHRDKKLGLALGILLVGIVGALFFRNESVPTDGAPVLQDAEALDRTIAENGTQLWPAQPSPRLAGTIESDSTPGDGTPVHPELDAGTAWSDPLFPDDPGVAKRLSRSPGPPDPIRLVPGDDVKFAPLPVPKHNKAWESPGDRAVVRPPDPAPADSLRTHVVQPGETLSGLAVRYLGSSARFQDIYAANRDRLKSPNDLRAGMTLRIPPRDSRNPVRPSSPLEAAPASRRASENETRERETAGAAAWPAAAKAAPASEPSPQAAPVAASEDAPAGPGTARFLPAPRSPLVPPGGAAGRRNAAAP